MSSPESEFLSRSKFVFLRKKWAEPDSRQGESWDFDGIPDSSDRWMSYDHEMREGLATFGCKSFDALVVSLKNKLGRKPVVVDVMGGAYFLNKVENTSALIGVRVHDKDGDFIDVYGNSNNQLSKSYLKITKALNRKIIEADILTSSGWNLIRRENLSADLLLCRPVGLFDNHRAMSSVFDAPEIYAGMYASLFRRMLSLVNRKNGVVFTEVPDIFSNKMIELFFSEQDSNIGSQTTLFTVPDRDYSWGGLKRRYAVIRFG